MSDVFVSYKAEDRARVRPLVTALESEGLSVWWDSKIEGGSDWREEIERELESARCVAVVWSTNSIAPGGRFVRDEASRAQRRGTYLPIRIDDVEPPLGFGETQALDLIGWKGRRNDRRYPAVVAAVRSVLAGRGSQRLPPQLSRGIDRRTVMVSAAGIGLAAAVGGWLTWNRNRPVEESASIAVLPFANLSGDPRQQYFADGIAEELRGALSRIAKLKVLGRTSSESVGEMDARSAARKLGVANVLTGSVRQSPSLIRISAQLVDGSDGIQLWSQTFNRRPGDYLAIQSEIAERVANALTIRLAPSELKAVSAGGTSSAEAHDLFLRAQALAGSSDSEESQRKALSLLDQAIALDPKYADAQATRSLRLTEITSNYADSIAGRQAGFQEAAQSARISISLAPQIPAGYSALGIALQNQLVLSAAEQQLQRAYQINRGDARMLRIYADFLGRIGKTNEARKVLAEAYALDPLHPRHHVALASIEFGAHRYAEAAAAARRGLELAPTRLDARAILANSLLLLGRAEQSQRELVKLPAGSLRRLGTEAILFSRTGDRAASDRALRELATRHRGAASFRLAEALAQRGEKDAAFAALESAWLQRDPALIFLRSDPWLDTLRADPRFAALEKRLQYPS